MNKFGSLPLLLAGGEDIKQAYLRQVAAGSALFAYALSKREAGSVTASMKTRAVKTSYGSVLDGQTSWITTPVRPTITP